MSGRSPGFLEAGKWQAGLLCNGMEIPFPGFRGMGVWNGDRGGSQGLSGWSLCQGVGLQVLQMPLTLLTSQNSFLTGVYPGSPSGWLAITIVTVGFTWVRVDVSKGLIGSIQRHLPIR